MMSLFSRYIFGQATSALLLILLSLTGVVWIALALKQLNIMTTQGQEAWLFFKMTLLALPNLMAVISPIALLIAVIHTLSRLNADSELIVMTAGGATVWRFARPLILLAVLVSFAVSIVNHFAMPWSLRQLRAYITQVRTDLLTQVLRPGKFNAPERNLTIHIRARGPDGELLGILMHDARKPKEVTSYLANRGRILKDRNGSYLVMQDGHIMRQEQNKPVSIITFENFPVDLSLMEKKGAVIRLRPRERYFSELVNPAGKRPLHKTVAGKYRSELHERFSNPLYPFAFVMIAVAFVGQAQTTRQSRTKAIIAAFVAAAGCRLLGLASTNLVTVSATFVPLVYAIPIIAIVLAIAVAHRKMRPRKASRLAVVTGNTFEWMIEWIQAKWRPKALNQPSS